MRISTKLSNDVQTFLNKSNKIEDWNNVIQETVHDLELVKFQRSFPEVQIDGKFFNEKR